jgi:hypothetical protein
MTVIFCNTGQGYNLAVPSNIKTTKFWSELPENELPRWVLKFGMVWASENVQTVAQLATEICNV